MTADDLTMDKYLSRRRILAAGAAVGATALFCGGTAMADPAARRAFIRSLSLPAEGEAPPAAEVQVEDGKYAGYVDDGSLVSFTAEVKAQTRQDVLDCVLLAQLAANRAHPREDDVIAWYYKYQEVLEYAFGWIIQGRGFQSWDSHTASFTVDKAISDVLAGSLRSADLQLAEGTVRAIRGLPIDDEKVKIFESESSEPHGGNFQVAVCHQQGDVVAMTLGAFYFSAGTEVSHFLWFQFSSEDANFYQGTRLMTFHEPTYAEVRQDVIDKLGDRRKRYVRELQI